MEKGNNRVRDQDPARPDRLNDPWEEYLQECFDAWEKYCESLECFDAWEKYCESLECFDAWEKYCESLEEECYHERKMDTHLQKKERHLESITMKPFKSKIQPARYSLRTRKRKRKIQNNLFLSPPM